MIRVALIGYGYAGRTFHAPLVRATPELDLALVCSRRPGQVRADLPAMLVVASPEEACARSDVELVVIATPNDSHAPIATIALQAGKHVVIDKPFALTVGDARNLSLLSRSTGRVLAAFQSRRSDG